jgi:hypothetical protein
MHRVDADGATAQFRFTNGNPNTGTPATLLEQAWHNDVQEEICTLIEEAGITLVKGDWDQLRRAIKEYYGKLAYSIEQFYPFMPGFPGLPSNYAWMDGIVIVDSDSPLDGFRVPNANGATVTGVPVTSLNNTLKTVTVSTNDIWAFGIGDTLTFTGASVPNAVVRSIDYSTGVIEVGDVTLWSSGLFGLTTGTLTGATAVSSVGVPRYPKGGLVAGAGIDTFQGHNASLPNNGSYVNTFPYAFGDNYIGVTTHQGSNSGISTLITDGVNGTPRTAQRTEPPSFNVRLAMKIK